MTRQPTQKAAASPPVSHKRSATSDPLGQSPDAPIEFEAKNAVARGNEERANAEPEPAALHSAKTPGVPDVAKERREIAAKQDDEP